MKQKVNNKQKNDDQQIDITFLYEILTFRKKSFNMFFLGITLLVLLVVGMKYIPLLYTLGVKYQYYCHHESIRSNLFYLDVDLENITPEQRKLFNEQNITCNITVLESTVLPSYIEIWDQFQKEQFGDGIVIGKKDLYSQQSQRLLIILLHIFFNGQTYLYPTQLLYNMQPKCLWRAYHGSELIFNKIDHYNKQRNIHVPSKEFTMLKVGYKNNWMIKKLIKSIIDKNQDWLQICNKEYQCTIMDCNKPQMKKDRDEDIRDRLFWQFEGKLKSQT